MGWFFVPVTCLALPLLTCVMLWRNRMVPKGIARWLNRVSAECGKFMEGQSYPPGMVVRKSIAAMVIIFRPGFDRDTATLRSCSGWLEHPLYYPGAGEYAFWIDCRFTKGNAWIELRDVQKHVVLRLDPKLSEGSVELQAGARYFLHWEFMNASGECELRWQYQGSGMES